MNAIPVDPTLGTPRADQVEGPHFLLSAKTIGQFREGIAMGDILNGRVIDVLGDDKSILQFRSFNLVTQSDLPFAKGDMIRAQVIGLGDQVTMRVVHPGGSLDQASAMLERLGIPVTRENVRTVALMLRTGVPLTEANVQQVFSGLGGGPGGPQAAELAVLARALGVPQSPASLETVRALTEPQVQLGDRLAQMSTQIARVLGDVPVEQGATLRGLGRVVTTLPLNPNADFTPQQLRWFLHYVGVRYEAALMSNMAPDASLKGLLLGARTELLEMTLVAQQRGESTTLIQALRGNIEGTLRHLDGSQMLARLASLNLPHMYLHIPFLGNLMRNPLTLEVRGRKRGPTEEMDADNTDIEFSVKTRRWGVVHMKLTIRSGRIRGSVETETAEGRKYIEDRLDGFLTRVSDIGYGVDRIVVLVSRSLDATTPIMQLPGLGGHHLDMEV